MKHETYTIHPEITKILGQFCEEIGIGKPEFPKPDPQPISPDFDARLIDYSDEYVDYKPGIVQERNS